MASTRYESPSRTIFADAGLPPEAEQLLLAAIRRAGFDASDEEERTMGLAAVTAALQVHEAAAGHGVRARAKVGRNDPCPCGSGRKHKKCCEGKTESHEGLGAPPFPLEEPALVPQLHRVELFAEDMENLARLFREDSGLRGVRFSNQEILGFVGSQALHQADWEAADEDATSARMDGWAARYFEEVEAPETLGKVEAVLLAAAPRCRGSVADLRALALGVSLTTLGGGPEESGERLVNPLYSLVFRESLAEVLEAHAAEDDPGGETDVLGALGAMMLPGGTTSLAELADRFWALSVPAGEGGEGASVLGEVIRAGRLPAGLILPSVLPCLARLATLDPGRVLGDEDLWEILAASGEELDVEDAELLAEGLVDWREEHGDRDGGETATWIGQVLGQLAKGTFGSLGLDLVLAALRLGNAPGLVGEPELAGGETLLKDALSADYLERYGDFLWGEGLPGMARRTWRLCELYGPLTPALEEKLAQEDR